MARLIGNKQSTVEGLCSDVFQRATQALPPLVTFVMGPAPPSSANSTTSPTSSELSKVEKFGMIIIPIIGFSCSLVMMTRMWRQRFGERINDTE